MKSYVFFDCFVSEIVSIFVMFYHSFSRA